MSISGEVTISLRDYENLIRDRNELQSVKEQLQEEKNKTWKLFGNFFQEKRIVVSNYEYSLLGMDFMLKVNNPTTYVRLPYFDKCDWNLNLIIEKLVKDHIADVVKAVDFSRLESYKSVK